MRFVPVFVPVKDEAQQANAVVFRARDLLVRAGSCRWTSPRGVEGWDQSVIQLHAW
jgi:hypothetical protein